MTMRPGRDASGTAESRNLRFADSYAEGEHGRFVRHAAKIGSLGAAGLLIDQPSGTYETSGTEDLVLCSVVSEQVEAGIDFGAGRFRYLSAQTPFFLSPPRAPSIFVVEDDHVARLLAVPMREVRELLGRHGLHAFDALEPLFSGGFHDPFLAGILPQLWQALAFEDRAGLLLQDSLLVTIILALQRAGGSRQTQRLRITGGLSPAMARKATEFLMAGIEEPRGLKALAEHCGMSEFHLHRAFTRTMGCSPHRWQFLKRMERARALLDDQRLSVLEVAIATGYESPQAFARVFRRHYGYTPGKYRQVRC